MRALSALAYFCAIAVWLTWPLSARLGTALNPGPDSLLNYWALGWNFHALWSDPSAFFDANIFAPRPDTLAYSEHLFGIAAVVWPIFAVTGNLVLTNNVAILLSFVVAGFGMFLLVRQLTESGWAGLVSGTVLLAAPYRFAHIGQLQLLSFHWIPIVLWCVLRFLSTGERRFLVGVVVSSLLQILSCNYYAVYLALSIVVLVCVLLVAGRSVLTRSVVLRSSVGIAVVSLVALPFFLPYLRNQESGFYRRYEDVVQFSAEPMDYLRPSSFNKAPHMEWLPKQVRSEKALFPGALAIVLAAFGVFYGARATKRSPLGRAFWIFFCVLGALAFVLSLGPETAAGTPLPYRYFYRHVPGFGGMRAPARMAVLALVATAALAGFGTLGLSRRTRSWVGAGVVALMLFEYQTYSLGRAIPDAPEVPLIYGQLAKLPRGVVLELPIHEGEAITRESVYMYYSTTHWMPLVNGFSGWWPNDYWEVVGRLRHFPTARILRFLLERAPVRYVVIHYDRFAEPRRRNLEDAMHRYRERMPVRARVGDDVLYEISSDDSR